MNSINIIFWDLGGVLLNNAWDHDERRQACKQFNLNDQEFEKRHGDVVPLFDSGKITLDQYLDHVIFCQEVPFSRAQFRDYMFALSKAREPELAFARRLAQSGKVRMMTLNNESRELNAYRIEKFKLNEIFSVFLSSCYLGIRKPDEAIYRLALEVTQQQPANCCFVDDREGNVAAAQKVGMHAIRMETLDKLQKDLAEVGVSV